MRGIALVARGHAIALPVVMATMHMVPIADPAGQVTVKTVEAARVGQMGFFQRP